MVMKIEFFHQGEPLWAYGGPSTPIGSVPRVGDKVAAWGRMDEDVNQGTWKVTEVIFGYYPFDEETGSCNNCIALIDVEPTEKISQRISSEISKEQ